MLGHLAPIGTNEFDIILDVNKVIEVNPNQEDPDLNKIDDIKEDDRDRLMQMLNDGGSTP